MTRLMVLGLLSLRAMSGYEIQRLIQMSHADEWAGIQTGSIYHALKKLDAEGLIQLDTVEQTGNRSKAIYRITDAGQTEYRDLVRQALSKPDLPFPSGLYVGLLFTHILAPDEALQALDAQMEATERLFQRSKLGQSQKTSLPALGNLIFEHMFQIYELHLTFLRRIQQAVTTQLSTKLDLPPMNEGDE